MTPDLTTVLDEIDLRLSSPMVTYKENATEDAPRLLAAVRAVLALAERWQEAGDHPAAAMSAGQAADILRAALTSALTGEVAW